MIISTTLIMIYCTELMVRFWRTKYQKVIMLPGVPGESWVFWKIIRWGLCKLSNNFAWNCYLLCNNFKQKCNISYCFWQWDTTQVSQYMRWPCQFMIDPGHKPSHFWPEQLLTWWGVSHPSLGGTRFSFMIFYVLLNSCLLID